MGRRLGVEPAAQIPRHQRGDGVGQLLGGNLAARGFVEQQRLQPIGRVARQAFVGQGRATPRLPPGAGTARGCAIAAPLCLLQGRRSRPRPTMPCARMCAVSASGVTCLICSASTSAPSRRLRRARNDADAASNVTASRSSILPAKRASISASVIGAASTMRLAAAAPVSSATARNGSRASAEAGSTVPPRPLASRKAPLPPPRLLAMRSG